VIYDYANYQAVICHAKTAISPWIAKRKKFSHNGESAEYFCISSKKLFLSYVTGVKIADFYVSL